MDSYFKETTMLDRTPVILAILALALSALTLTDSLLPTAAASVTADPAQPHARRGRTAISLKTNARLTRRLTLEHGHKDY